MAGEGERREEVSRREAKEGRHARDRLGGMVDTTKGRRCRIPRNETGVKKEKKPEKKSETGGIRGEMEG